MNEEQTAIALGYHENFFSHLRMNTPELIDQAKEWGNGDLYDGFIVYQKEADSNRDKIAKIYYELLECRALSRFFRENADELEYSTAGSFITSIKSMSFKMSENRLRHQGFLSTKKIIDVFEKWAVDGFTRTDKQLIAEMYGEAS